jgi:hypothetical protein
VLWALAAGIHGTKAAETGIIPQFHVPNFSPNAWHHIQSYVTTDTNAHTYTYRVLVVDGQSYQLNVTRKARYLGWGDNLGAHWQLDVNATGGGYHEWVDSSRLWAW